MLIDDVKKRMIDAMKAGRAQEKEILRVALGDLQLTQSRTGSLSDDEAVKVLRKIIKANDETAAVTSDEAVKAKLAEENRILSELLPQTLDQAQIKAALAPVDEAIRNAPNAGAATGVAMKHLKSTGATVDGKDVAQVVAALRGG
ncbi:GatB/YqeY domain-containing protein [Planctomycetales bacterium ZRK34]|nr:GatB/YqeY domain-containing protein [Planctomycetales bacterium ZRK34]